VIASKAKIILEKLAGLPYWIWYSKNKSKEKTKSSWERDQMASGTSARTKPDRAFSFGGEMAKAKSKKKSTAKGSPPVDSKAKTAEEIQKVRNIVINMILANSKQMTARVVKSVTEGGQVAALKYLWEMSGMFPFEAGENGERESLAKILLARMGLQGRVPVIPGDDEGDVESEDEVQNSE